LRSITWTYVKHIQLFENIGELSILRRLLAVLTGYKTELKTLQKEVYLYSMEEAPVQNGIIHRRLRLFAGAETDRYDVARTLENFLASNQRRDLWATPRMPMLLFALLALMLNGFVGDFSMWRSLKLSPAWSEGKLR